MSHNEKLHSRLLKAGECIRYARIYAVLKHAFGGEAFTVKRDRLFDDAFVA